MRSLLLTSLSLIGYLAADTAHADDHLRLRYGKSSDTDFLTVMLGDFQASQEGTYMIDGTWSRDISPTFFGLPLPNTGNIGVQYFNERGLQPDALGVTAYYKIHYFWRLPFTQKHLRFGLGEGLSYVDRIPQSEVRDFAHKHVESSKLMNYLDWSIDLPLRQYAVFDNMMRGTAIKEAYLGFTVFHRSSVFGLFAETKGGINYMGFGFEAQY